jgi:hypothetical protein
MKSVYTKNWLGLTLIFFVVGSQSVTVGDDAEYRAGVENIVGLSEHWKGALAYQSRYDSHGDQSRQHTDVGVIYLGKIQWFDIGARYRTLLQYTDELEWIKENRYYLDMTGRHAWYDLGFSHRIRLEYNDWEDRLDDFGTLRYRIAINPPHALSRERERRIIKDYKYRPYAKYELAATTFDEGIISHSFEAGISIGFTEVIIGELYYMHQENGSTLEEDDWNTVGLELKILL